MVTEVMAIGTTELASAIQTLAAGESAVYFLKNDIDRYPLASVVEVQFITSNGTWMTHKVMGPKESAVRIDGPIGSFRFYRRSAGDNPAGVGVDKA